MPLAPDADKVLSEINAKMADEDLGPGETVFARKSDRPGYRQLGTERRMQRAVERYEKSLPPLYRYGRRFVALFLPITKGNTGSTPAPGSTSPRDAFAGLEKSKSVPVMEERTATDMSALSGTGTASGADGLALSAEWRDCAQSSESPMLLLKTEHSDRPQAQRHDRDRHTIPKLALERMRDGGDGAAGGGACLQGGVGRELGGMVQKDDLLSPIKR